MGGLNLAAIPLALKERPQWVLWRRERRHEKLTKVLKNARTGRSAESDEPGTWSTFDEAVEGLEVFGECDGIGYVFASDDPYVGIDLDSCAGDEGELAEWAQQIVDSVNSYTEYSPSRKGVHTIARGTLPPGRRRKGPFEMYSEGRYFTITGDHLWDTPGTIEDREEEIIALHRWAFPEEEERQNGAAPSPVSEDDEGLMARALRANPRMERLWQGDRSGYDSGSEADLALCNHLAWWTGNDAPRIERLFERSGLVREKWTKRADYRAMTIGKAVSGTTSTYQPAVNGARAVPGSSLNSLHSSTPEPFIEADWPAPLAPEAFHGIAGEVVRAIYEESEADEAALLINFLVTFGNAVGRNPHGMAGKTRHGTNLFAGLVGRTGDARKGTSWDPIHDLFDRALPVYTREHIQGSVASGEGLISLVRDRHEKRVQIKDKKTGRMTMDYETVVEDEGVDDKRLLIVDSEMSGLLKVMGRTGNILSEQLRKAWETGDLQNLNKTSPLKATGSHISIVGHITPDGLSKHLTEAESANGFGNRYIWLVVKRSKPLPEGGDIPPLNNYVTDIKQLVELASEKARIGRDADARLMWKEVYQDLTAAGVGMFGELTARRAPIVLRLSLIYALLDGFDIVLPAHLLAALAVWERSEESVRFLFGDATGDPTGDALYEAMVNRPEGTTRTDLHAALGRNRPVSEIDRALTALHRAGRARVVRQKSEHGREVEAWHANWVVDRAAKTTGYLAKAKAVLAELEREHERIQRN